MLLRAAPVAAAALLAAGCGGGNEAAATSSLAPGCGVPEIERVVTAFLGAVTAGDRARLSRLLSPALESFTVHDGRGASERRARLARRREAVRYLLRRHRANERQRLLALRVLQGNDANTVVVAFRLTRVADDFRARRIFDRLASGDGKIDCVRPAILAWSVEGP